MGRSAKVAASTANTRQRAATITHPVCYAAAMRENETEREMVERHVKGGAANIIKQRELIARLQRKSLSTAEAEALLATFEAVQNEHEDHLMRIGSVQP